MTPIRLGEYTCLQKSRETLYFCPGETRSPGRPSFAQVNLDVDPKWETFAYPFESKIQGIYGQYKGETARAYWGDFFRVLRVIVEPRAHPFGAKEEEEALRARAEYERKSRR